ncbi:MAG: CDC27 family protein, partial [Hydrogenimonas sp.]|nr:CDC27 family protein [Hydrogenimonas sp.]
PTLLSSHKSETKSSITSKEEPAKGRKETVLQVKEVSDMDALLEQYKNSPRYSVALKIAQLYFDDGDFEKASLWARKANLLDRDDERAWLIYAQSEYALGREKRAERILRLYLDYKDSPKARSLLMTWSSQ